jgi:hypothetical protein
MSIRFTTALAGVMLCGALLAGNVGETSEWGIVITPCAWCGATNDIQVHHIVPQHVCKTNGHPEWILDMNNMVCLCRTDGKGCHFYIGHHGISWNYVFTNIMAVIREGKK